MDKACKNCRFCIYAHSRGKDEPYCERHNKWIGKTILCSEWDAVIVPKPITNADRIRSMTDEELARLAQTGGGRMNCTNCINKGKLCLSCEGQFYARPVKKPERELSAWEKRWIRWVKKNER